MAEINRATNEWLNDCSFGPEKKDGMRKSWATAETSLWCGGAMEILGFQWIWGFGR